MTTYRVYNQDENKMFEGNVTLLKGSKTTFAVVQWDDGSKLWLNNDTYPVWETSYEKDVTGKIIWKLVK